VTDAATLGKVTAAFPPSFISSGNGDPLAPQAVARAQKLSRLGVRVDALLFPADRDLPLPHEYQFNLDDAAGREALNRMLAFLDPRSGLCSCPIPRPHTAVNSTRDGPGLNP
jgi:acetyl esterase